MSWQLIFTVTSIVIALWSYLRKPTKRLPGAVTPVSSQDQSSSTAFMLLHCTCSG